MEADLSTWCHAWLTAEAAYLDPPLYGAGKDQPLGTYSSLPLRKWIFEDLGIRLGFIVTQVILWFRFVPLNASASDSLLSPQS